MTLQIRPIKEISALELIFENHYSKIMPRLTKHYLGGFLEDKLVGVMTLGWGTRPLHTIKKLFPSLKSEDYYEIGKMCMLEEMPRNSESQFLSGVMDWIKKNQPQIKILYTWADGILGKPGYVYQAANFLYGGYIWTDLYVTDEGEKIHPRTSQGLTDKGDKVCGHRPTKDWLKSFGWHHYKGKQFRYLHFLCNKREKKQLLKESSVEWGINYPKKEDLEWKLQNLDTGEWCDVANMFYNPHITTNSNKKSVKNQTKLSSFKVSKTFFDF